MTLTLSVCGPTTVCEYILETSLHWKSVSMSLKRKEELRQSEEASRKA